MRQIVLDTETTGLDASEHRIIEIGCVELVNRRVTDNHYHQFIQPDRAIDQGAFEVHGISNDFLKDKPRFADISQDFLKFINGAELIIHNAPFDVGFINAEFQRLAPAIKTVEHYCQILDTLTLARKMHPGQKNNLDALCKRYQIDNSMREKHGALLDAEILAEVYLAMTGGQETLLFGEQHKSSNRQEKGATRKTFKGLDQIPVIAANEAELVAHQEKLNELDKACQSGNLWRAEN